MISDPFVSALADLVRNMPDEAIVDLVRERLGVLSAASGRSGSGRARRSSRTPRPNAQPSAAAAPKRTQRKGKRTRLSADARNKLRVDVESAVKRSKGVSLSDVAAKLGKQKHTVAAVLRELKAEGKIFQGGERRFARYAGSKPAATAASKRAQRG